MTDFPNAEQPPAGIDDRMRLTKEVERLTRKVEAFEADREFHDAQRQKILRLEDLTRDLTAERNAALSTLQEAMTVLGEVAKLTAKAMLAARDFHTKNSKGGGA